METIPPPVDINRLKNILGGAKKLMNIVESGNFSTGHIDGEALTEDGVQRLYSEGRTAPMQMPQQASYDEDTIRNSRLPDVVKKAMIERPIPQLSNPLSHTFNLSDVSDLMEDKPMGPPKAPKTRVVESKQVQNGDMITISRSQLTEIVNGIVNERLLDYFQKMNNRAITEDAVKKTYNLLLKEGRIQPKKKTL